MVVLRDLQIGHHALHLARELRAALRLELGQDGPLVVVVGAPVEKQTPGQFLAVKLAEKVLIADVGQELDHLLQRHLHLLVRKLLAAALLEQLVTEKSEQLGRRAPRDDFVAENFERFLQSAMEQGVVAEAVHDVLEILVVELDDGPDKDLLGALRRRRLVLGSLLLRSLRILRLLHQGDALLLHVLLEYVRHRGQSRGDPLEQPEHPRQVLRLVVSEQHRTAAVLLLQQLSLVRRENLFFNLLQQLGLRRRVKVVPHPLLLPPQALLRLDQVIRARVLVDPHGSLPAVKRRCVREQVRLEVLLVRLHPAHAHLHEDAEDVLDQRAVDLLAVAFLIHQREHRVLDVLLELGIDEVAEAQHAHVLQLREVVTLNVVPVEVVEEAREPPDHDLVVVPALHELLQHVLALLLAQRGEDVGGDVRVESLAVPLVQLLGEVVGRFLRAHIVDGAVRAKSRAGFVVSSARNV